MSSSPKNRSDRISSVRKETERLPRREFLSEATELQMLGRYEIRSLIKGARGSRLPKGESWESRTSLDASLTLSATVHPGSENGLPIKWSKFTLSHKENIVTSVAIF